MEFSDLLAVLYGLAGDIHNATFYAKLASTGKSSDKMKAWLPDSLPRFTAAFFEMAERPFFNRALADSGAGQLGERGALVPPASGLPSTRCRSQCRSRHDLDDPGSSRAGDGIAARGAPRVAQGRPYRPTPGGRAGRPRAVSRKRMPSTDPRSPRRRMIRPFSPAPSAICWPTPTARSKPLPRRRGRGENASVWRRTWAPPVREPALKRRLTVGYLVGAVDRSHRGAGPGGNPRPP